MLEDVKIPTLGENIASGDVVRVLVNKGDSVKKDQSILELETDKAVLEIPSPVEGTVQEILVKPGEKAKINQVVLRVETSGGAPAQAPQKTDSSQKVALSSTEEKPTPQEKKKLDVKPDLEAELTPAESEPQGLARSTREASPAPEPRPAAKVVSATPPEKKSASKKTEAKTGTPLASPSVRRLAREIGVDLSEVTGTGSGGRITEEDVKGYSRRSHESEEVPGVSPPAAVDGRTLPDFSKWGPVEEKAFTNVRRATAVNMSHAWNTIPHVTQFDQADITEVLELRKKFSKRVEAAGGNLTITAILLKVSAAALKVFPQFNASIDVAGQRTIYKKYTHIGVAVDTERGLIVPVIRDVDKKNILELSVELNQAAERARNRKTALDEMQGGSFTITNLGSIGGSHFTPIVNWPEVAILGVGRASQRPVWTDGQWVPRMILPLSLSYDHRLIDGADAARFLRWLADAVQEPFLMDLEG